MSPQGCHKSARCRQSPNYVLPSSLSSDILTPAQTTKLLYTETLILPQELVFSIHLYTKTSFSFFNFKEIKGPQITPLYSSLYKVCNCQNSLANELHMCEDTALFFKHKTYWKIMWELNMLEIPRTVHLISPLRCRHQHIPSLWPVSPKYMVLICNPTDQFACCCWYMNILFHPAPFWSTSVKKCRNNIMKECQKH